MTNFKDKILNNLITIIMESTNIKRFRNFIPFEKTVFQEFQDYRCHVV